MQMNSHSGSNSKSAAVRAKLNHPIIDADGHAFEFEPMFVDHLRAVAGPSLVERYKSYGDVYSRFIGGTGETRSWYSLSAAERRYARLPHPGGWGTVVENALDRVTAIIPQLYYDRMPETGIDFSVIYPSLGFAILTMEDEELRRACCRALNNYLADIYSGFEDRMTPAAIIPMHTPQEAIDELEHVVKNLKLKVVVMASFIRRPIPMVAERYPEASQWAYWVDTFGLDSAYDYDPLWQKCLDLKVSPSFHSPSSGWANRASISNYMFNQIGMFSEASHALCKSLFLGGVTRRFPDLRFAFLEGGAAWGATLYSDLISRWSKRNIEAMHKLDPELLDRAAYEEYFRKYGGKLIENGRIDRLWEDRLTLNVRLDADTIDDFAHCKIEKPEDIRDLFVPNFFFGCEADDPMTGLAFDTKRNPFGVKINAMFGSDISHWDVPDPLEIVEEAYEMVEHGQIDEEDFRTFTFASAARLLGGTNPDFFKGTAVEKATEELLQGEGQRGSKLLHPAS